MGKYQTYPEYKNSGVEWLDNIPEHWNIAPIKRVASFITGMTPSTSVSEYYSDEETDFEWIRPEDIKETNESVSSSKFLTRLGWNTQRVVPAHSSLICCIGTIGKIGYVLKPVTTNQQITSATFYFSSKYYFYVLLAARTELEIMSAGNVVRILNTDRLGRINVPLIMEAEALTIANFLDHETAKIDALIEKQQQLMSLLQEKRQAVISHAVTKGLNPDVPMKDSGVEWLGQVPEHWEIKKAKHLFDFITSGSRGWAEHYSDNGNLFFRIANLTRNTIEPKLNSIQYVLPPKGAEGERSKIRLNDILISITADLGSVCVANESIVNGFVSQHVALCRPNTLVNSSRWLAYFILSNSAKEQFLGSGYGGTKIQLSLEDVRELVIAFPSLDEQKSIESYLDKRLSLFETLIEKSQSQVDLLKERRTALISAAVTGKIDVRNWQAPSQSPSTSTEEQAL
ncbi:restriction endonuclease subunit S [Plesiomonas shigelloides]|uniref:restriction endonuclease subunit S n=1 Tax=Plesiomonas shigelloides TaxID=703 RepID=UPI00387EF527